MMRLFFLVLLVIRATLKASASPEVYLGEKKILRMEIPTLSQDVFGGIPYAEAPVRSLRLAPPVLKVPPDSNVFNATEIGKACFQGGLTADQVSEDCLSINVFRPSNVFLTHGSGFATSSSAMFNASTIVAQSMKRGTPILFVSINYRLGPLGWPQGSEADAEGILNLGLKDQIAGLQWVQQNIEAFGGDKNKVTIGGASAGSIMSTVSTTLFMHSSAGNLSRAGIFESGFPGTSPIFNATHRQSSWDTFVAGVASCQNVTSDITACLKSANASEILQGVIDSTEEAQAFGPALDGPNGFFPDLPSKILANGPKVNFPFIAGQNKDEGTNFVIDPTLNYTPTLVGLGLQEEYSPPELSQDSVDELLQLYPNIPSLGCPFGTGNENFGLAPAYKEAAALATDILFTSQRRFFTQLAVNSSVRAFGYYFTQETSSTAPDFGVTHGNQVPYTFGTLTSVNETAPSAIFLSEAMIDYFVSFVNSLDPNDGHGVSRPQWPQYTANSPGLLQLNGESLTEIQDDFRFEQTSYIVSQMTTFHQ